jgi:archaellum component FlaF (FlaF/FlaG flagellin family)
MGLSVAASSAILFTGFLLVATVLFTAINSTFMGIEDRFKQAQDQQNDMARTLLRVDNVTNNTTVMFINVTNIGSNTLKVSDMNVLVNGTLVTNRLKKHSVGGNTATEIWAPKERLYLELTYKTKTGARVNVIAGNGVSASGLLT